MSTDINTVVIAGRLTRDAELSYTQSGTALCKLSMAVNRSVKNGNEWTDEANFFDCTLWGKRGESLNQYLSKGQQIVVQGQLRQERWDKDGQKRSKVTIHVDNIQLTGGKKDSQPDYSPKTDPNHQTGGFQDDFPDKIPF